MESLTEVVLPEPKKEESQDTLVSNLPPKKPTKKKSSYKDLDPETKNRRITQNRAAQRAFRERKERKMRELEDKVKLLESSQRETEVEADFLRGQLLVLVHELKKYRPETTNDSAVLKYLSDREPRGNQVSQTSNRVGKASLDTGVSSLLQGGKDSQFHEKEVNYGTTPGSSESSIPSGLQFDKQNMSIFTNDYDFSNQFDEKVSEFCNKMNRACGTKQRPIPQRQAGNVGNNAKSGSTLQSSHNLSSPGTSSFLGTNSPALTNTWEPNSVLSNIQGSPLSGSVLENSLYTGFNETPSSDEQRNNSVQFGQAGFESSTNSQHNILDTLDTVPSLDFSNEYNMDSGLPATSSSSSNNSYVKTSSDGLQARKRKHMDNGVPFLNLDLAFPSNDDTLFMKNDESIIDQFLMEENQDFQTQAHVSDATDYLVTKKLVSEDPMIATTPSPISEGKLRKYVNPTIKGQVAQDSPAAHTPTSETHSGECSLDEDASQTTMSQMLKTHSTNNTNENVDEEDDGQLVVPYKDDRLLRCSEIWDRITAHPKYSDIDIDGLCSELMAKAKCSEKGVVINSDDVQTALTKHMC